MEGHACDLSRDLPRDSTVPLSQTSSSDDTLELFLYFQRLSLCDFNSFSYLQYSAHTIER
jgi:hypothetical protein